MLGGSRTASPSPTGLAAPRSPPWHPAGVPHGHPAAWPGWASGGGERGDPRSGTDSGSQPQRRSTGSPGSEAARRYGPSRAQGRQPRPCTARDILCGKRRVRQRGEVGAGHGSPPPGPLLPPPGPAAGSHSPGLSPNSVATPGGGMTKMLEKKGKGEGGGASSCPTPPLGFSELSH